MAIENSQSLDVGQNQSDTIYLTALLKTIKNSPEESKKVVDKMRELIQSNPQFKNIFDKIITTKAIKDLSDPENQIIIKTYWVLFLWKSTDEVWLTQQSKWNDLIYGVALESIKWTLSGKVNELFSWAEQKLWKKIEWFDKEKVIWDFSKMVEQVLLDPKVPEIVKNKFLSDLSKWFENIEWIKPEHVSILREKRESRSWYYESWKPDGFYLWMLITANITKWLDLKVATIQRCFQDETQELNGRTYHKKELEKYKDSLWKLDVKYWLTIWENLSKTKDYNINPFQDIVAWLSKYNKNLPSMVENEDPSLETLELDINWKKVKYQIIIWEYIRTYASFQNWNSTNFELPRKHMLSNSTWDKLSSLIDWWNIPELEWIDNLIENKINNLEFADIMILIWQVSTMIPVLWDAAAAKMDFSDFMDWIDASWEKTGILTWLLWVFLDWLWILWVWAILNSISKAKRMEKTMKLLEKGISSLTKNLKSWKLTLDAKSIEALKKFENLPFGIWDAIKDIILKHDKNWKTMRKIVKKDSLSQIPEWISVNEKWERVSLWVQNNDVLVKNWNLSDTERLNEAENILWLNLSQIQKDAILEAHNIESWNNIVKWRILMGKWWFSKEQARILMDFGICWKFEGKFKIWDIIKFKRNNWVTVEGKIIHVTDNEVKVEYKNENWVLMEKYIKKADVIQDQTFEMKFKMWSKVFVKRSNGWESEAVVSGYNPQNNTYTVTWQEWWISYSKNVWESSLRAANSNVILTNEQRLNRAERSIERSEVIRKKEVIAIWDLNWNIEALRSNLSIMWLIDKNKNWIWWDREVVFLWDILGDRSPNWLKILEEVERLNEQATKIWWKLKILWWNHDDYAISKLMWKSLAWWWHEISGSDWIVEFAEKYWNWSRNWDVILRNMRNSQEWMRDLERICRMNLVDIVDDTLFVHTDITGDMANLIKSPWINRLNEIYQQGLRKVLINWEWLGSIKEAFTHIVNVFLNTANRSYMSEAHWKLLKEMWINQVIHWHSDNGGRVENIWWVTVTSIDNSHLKWGNNYWNWHSVAIIRRDWNVQVRWERSSITWGSDWDDLYRKWNWNGLLSRFIWAFR